MRRRRKRLSSDEIQEETEAHERLTTGESGKETRGVTDDPKIQVPDRSPLVETRPVVEERPTMVMIMIKIYIRKGIYMYEEENPQRDVACKIGPTHNLNLFHVNLLNV